MSTAPVFRGDLTPVLDGETFLSPCRVTATEVDGVEVALPSGEHAKARMAVAFVYAPAVGDELLVIGRDERYFVIGVIHTQGEMRLDFPGDVRITSAGDVRLEAGDSISLTSREVDIEASKVQLVADIVVETAHELYTRVRDVLSIRAGEKRERVTGEWNARADKATITTGADVSVNGEQIRLG